MTMFRAAGLPVLRALVVVALLATISGCGRSGGPDRSGRESGTRTPAAQPAPTVGAAGSTTAQEDAAAQRRPLPAVSGEIYVRERITFPAGTVVKVRVVRLGVGGSVTGVVAAVELPAPRHIPIPFEVICDPESIDQGGAYALEAEIVRGKAAVFTTASPVPVLAGGVSTSGVKLLLRRAS